MKGGCGAERFVERRVEPASVDLVVQKDRATGALRALTNPERDVPRLLEQQGVNRAGGDRRPLGARPVRTCHRSAKQP